MGFTGHWDILDRGYLELQDTMGDDMTIVNAARVSFLADSKGEVKDKKLLAYLWEHNELGPFEQVRFKFRIKAPIIVSRQWMRYRMGSFNEQSYRYTEALEEDFYIPSEWRLQDAKNKQGSSGLLLDIIGDPLTAQLEQHVATSYKLYQDALEVGVAREQARLFLPAFSLYTTYVWSVDARNLLHFLDQRCDEHAQWEIRQYANCIRDNVLGMVLPWTKELYSMVKPNERRP